MLESAPARLMLLTVLVLSLPITGLASPLPPHKLPWRPPNLISYQLSDTNVSLNLGLEFPSAPALPSTENQTSAWPSVAGDTESFNPSTWVLSTTKLRNNSFAIQPYSANGYIGVRIPVQGQGFAYDVNTSDPNGPPPQNGWPLFDSRFTGAFVAGFWDYQPNTTGTNFPELLKKGGESVISTLPVWTSIYVTDVASNSTYTPLTKESQISNWTQSLSLKNGLVHTNLTWSPAANLSTSYQLNYTVLTHRNRPNLGIVRLDITSKHNTSIVLQDILDGAGSMRTTAVDKDLSFEPAIWTAVQPVGIRNVTAYEYSSVWFSDSSAVKSTNRNTTGAGVSSNDSTISQSFTVRIKPNSTFTIIKYVGIASTDAFPDPFSTARIESSMAVKQGWNALLKEHNSAWEEIWDEGDIVVPGDDELQASIRATLFHLISNVRSGNESHGLGDNSIPVSGLSSDSYAGFIFWDADTWMNPGLQALFPNFASSIVNYRDRLEKQAVVNAQQSNFTGAVFPWTSSRFGNCTATGPCLDYEYHINTDIAQAQWQYYLTTNDTAWLKSNGWPLIRNAADFYTQYVVMNGSTDQQYYTYNLTDPDEYANHVDNGAYTNAGIALVMQWATQASKIVGAKANPKWLDIASKIHIPQNTSLDLTLEYDGMNGTTVIKQADVVLLTYPLGYNQTTDRAATNLQYYAEKQSPDGPAMTYAIFAIDSAELSTSGCSAYTYLLYSSQPYLRRPFYQFSEQLIDDPTLNGGTNPAFPFLTGHGGYLQVYTHGLTGFRPQADALYLDPTLPPQLDQGVVVKGLKFQGGVFDINITTVNTTITRRDDWKFTTLDGISKPNKSPIIPIRIGSRNVKAGNFSLQVNETLTVPTYRPDLNTLYPGNMAQCKPITAEGAWVPGKFPVSINDGDNSTYWQPQTPERTVVTVDLGSAKSFSSAYFLWGDSPPMFVSLGIPLVSNSSNVTVVANATANATVSSSKAGNFTQWIVSNRAVQVSQPFNAAANTSDLMIPVGNETLVSLGSFFTSRFVQIAIEGAFGSNTTGGTLAEFSLT